MSRKIEMTSTKKGNVKGKAGLGTKRRKFVGPVRPPGTSGWRCRAGAQEKDARNRFGNLCPGAKSTMILRPHLPQWAHGKG